MLLLVPSVPLTSPTNMHLSKQGAGETLRGNLNYALDKRSNASPETLAAHQEVINSGRQELQTGTFSERTRNQEGAPPKLKGILRKPRGDVGEYNQGGGPDSGHESTGYASNGNGKLRVVNG